MEIQKYDIKQLTINVNMLSEGKRYQGPLEIIGSTRRDGQTSTRLNQQQKLYTSTLPTPTNEGTLIINTQSVSTPYQPSPHLHHLPMKFHDGQNTLQLSVISRFEDKPLDYTSSSIKKPINIEDNSLEVLSKDALDIQQLNIYKERSRLQSVGILITSSNEGEEASSFIDKQIENVD